VRFILNRDLDIAFDTRSTLQFENQPVRMGFTLIMRDQKRNPAVMQIDSPESVGTIRNKTDERSCTRHSAMITIAKGVNGVEGELGSCAVSFLLNNGPKKRKRRFIAFLRNYHACSVQRESM